MKLMIIVDWNGSTIQEIGAKFASGEDVVPEGAELISRWHDPGAKKAWAVVDAPDAETVQRWMLKWSNMVDFETHAVLDDAGAGALLGEMDL